MEPLIEALDWLRDNPRIAIAIVVATMTIWGLAQRKPKVFREADREFERLRNERGPSYDNTRRLP